VEKTSAVEEGGVKRNGGRGINTSPTSLLLPPLLQKEGGGVAALEGVWKLFVLGSQEQLTRLRVAGVFYRTMEQVMKLAILLFL